MTGGCPRSPPDDRATDAAGDGAFRQTDDDPSRRQFDAPSRRRVLTAIGTASAGLLAGCSYAPSASPRELDGPSAASQTLPERPDTIFMADVARTGHWPDRSVPDAVSEAWSIPDINTGDHTAAKSSPLVVDGDVLVPGDTGAVHSVTPAGERNWSASLHDSERGTHSTPAVVEEYVFTAGYDGAVYAFDADSGDELWRTKVSDAIGSSPVYYDGLVYVATEFYTPSGGMVALDAATGALVWEDNRMTNHAHSITGIDVDARRFAAGCNDGSLYVWNLDTREFEGSFETGGPIKGPVCMYDGLAVFGSWDGSVYAVDTTTLERVWAEPTGRRVMSGAALHPETGVVVIGNHGGTLYALDLTTGEREWSFDTDGMIVGSVTVADGTALVGSYDTTLYAVDVESGEKRWSFETPHGWVTSAPAVHDGAVYATERARFEDETMVESGYLYKLTAA